MQTQAELTAQMAKLNKSQRAAMRSIVSQVNSLQVEKVGDCVSVTVGRVIEGREGMLYDYAFIGPRGKIMDQKRWS